MNVEPKDCTRKRPPWRFALACALVIALAGPVPARAQSGTEATPKPGIYRATLQLPGGELPFGLRLERAGTGWIGYLINGKERVRLDEVTVDSSRLIIKMPGYENRMTVDVRGETLEGELVLDKLGGKDQHIPVKAAYRETYRFFPPPAQVGANVSGRWSVTFTEEGAHPESAVGEFVQSGDVVRGTFLTDTGDHRFLAGQVRGDKLFLSTFDGAHAFLYEARITARGELSGDFWSGTAFHERWTARKDPNAALPDAYSLTALRSRGPFTFEFPDLSGHAVSSNDPQFKNKVLIVALAGSWCPNCHDEAAFLAPLYDTYRGRGLEIVSLMFEHFGDFDRAAAATQRFRQRYGIHYTTLVAGISDKEDAAKKLPALDRVYAFPTVIFIDRQGMVRRIHTGFSGPATGSHYLEFVADFKQTLDNLLAET